MGADLGCCVDLSMAPSLVILCCLDPCPTIPSRNKPLGTPRLHIGGERLTYFQLEDIFCIRYQKGQVTNNYPELIFYVMDFAAVWKGVS